jgi:hypothetical protein
LFHVVVLKAFHHSQNLLKHSNVNRYKLALFNNTCLCGPVPSWLATNVSSAAWAVGTGLAAACPTNSTCSQPPLPPLAHPDIAQLQALKTAAVSVPAGTATAVFATWDPARPPCSEFDPLCLPCTLEAPSASCGGPAPADPAAPALPRWYCNYQGLACRDGRVVAVNLTGLGVAFGALPPRALALDRAEALLLGGNAILSGPLPANMSALPALGALVLQGGGIGGNSSWGALPADWGQLNALRSLRLSNAVIEGALPRFLAGPNLTELTLDSLTFASSNATLPAEWASSAPALRRLSVLNVTGLVGGLPTAWATGLPSLEALEVADTPTLWPTLDAAASVLNAPRGNATAGTGLSRVVLVNVGLVGTVPDAIFGNPRLAQLSLARNSLSGTVPSAWATPGAANVTTAAASLRVLDLSDNLLSGELPIGWRALNATALLLRRNAFVGFLPREWAEMPATTATDLDVSGNNLTGPIPELWGTRAAGWRSITLAINTRMCGALPAWFTTRFGNGTAVLAGTGLGSICSPLREPFAFFPAGSPVPNVTANGTNATNTTTAQSPPPPSLLIGAGDNVDLRLASAVPLPLLQGVALSAALIGPNSTVQRGAWALPLLTPGNSSSGPSIWGLTLAGWSFQQAGVYQIQLQTSPAVVITSAPVINVTVVPPSLSPLNSSMAVQLPASGTAVGGNATVTLALADMFGNPRRDAAGASVEVVGSSTGVVVVNSSNLLRPVAGGAPGTFAFTYRFAAIQNVTFQFVANGSRGAAPIALRANGVLPTAVNFTSSLAAAAVRVEGSSSAALPPPLAGAVVVADAWHSARVPVLRAGAAALGAVAVINTTTANTTNTNSATNATTSTTSNTTTAANATTDLFPWPPGGTRFLADPLLNTTLRAVPLMANGTRNESAARVFAGRWLPTAGEYAYAFKLPPADPTTINTTYAVALTLAHPSGLNATVESLVTATLRLAAPRSCNFSVLTASVPDRAGVGEPVYVLATLLSSLLQPVSSASNVAFTVVGSSTGALRSVPPLTRSTDGTWSFTLFPSREETWTISMSVGGIAVTSRTLVVSGRSPFSVDTSRSLAAATLASQRLSVTDTLDAAASPVVFTAEAAVASVPVYDVFGALYPSDPGLRVRLSLVPAAIQGEVLARYGLTPPAGVTVVSSSSSTTTSSNGTSTNGTTATTVTATPQRRLLQANTTNTTSPSPSPAVAPSPSPPPASNATNTTSPSPSPAVAPSPSPAASPSPSPPIPSSPAVVNEAGWVYFADYGAPASSSSPSPAPAPSPSPSPASSSGPVLAFERPGLDLGSALQDGLAADSRVVTFAGAVVVFWLLDPILS